MKRFISTIILTIGAIAAIVYLPIFYFKLLIGLITALALWEVGSLTLKGFQYARLAQFVFGLFFFGLLLWHQDLESVLLFLIFATFISFLIVMRRTKPIEESIHRLALILFGLIYIGATLPFWSWLKEMPQGHYWVALAILPATLTDIFAFLAGKSFGKHFFAPILSPNKTWEGFIAAFFGSLLGVYITKHFFLPELVLIDVILISLGLWIVSPLGDLAESLIKRSVNVKDSSHLIPGHGGILDRMDALVFAAPFVYAYAKYVIGV